jgi:DNA-binding SARP family transcriptional activator
VIVTQLSKEARPWAHRASAAPPVVSICLLGGFELRVDGQPVLLPLSAKRLLVFLALVGHRPMARSYVSQSLWLGATERHADGNLRSALWKVGQFGASAIQVSRGQLALASRVTVDYQESAALALDLLHDPKHLSEWEIDEEIFTRDLLPDWFDEWIVAERERYRQLRLHALEDLCLEHISRRSFGRAIQAGLAAVAGEPLRESANQALIHAYLAEGNAAEAIRHYYSFRDLLWDELRVPASSAMSQLIEELADR